MSYLVFEAKELPHVFSGPRRRIGCKSLSTLLFANMELMTSSPLVRMAPTIYLRPFGLLYSFSLIFLLYLFYIGHHLGVIHILH